MNQPFLLEVYIDSVDSALAAEAGGAGRLELCANLLEGGTTPSAGMIQTVCKAVQIPVNVIIRPRGGDFLYSDVEFEIMKRDVQLVGGLGAQGVVIGMLDAQGCIDKKRCAELIALARPLSVTFHKAFDMTCDPFGALEDLIEIGVDRVLTSGQEASVIEGLDLIEALCRQAKGRISVMPGGGLSERNLSSVLARTGVKEVHASVLRDIESGMQFRNPRCFMGGIFRPPEYSRSIVDTKGLSAMIESGK